MEPEELLIDGARRAAVVVRELWWRARPAQAHGELPLARVKRRLELVAGALYGDTPAIVPSDPPPRPTWLARAFGRVPRHLIVRTAVASTDGEVIWLPRAVETAADDRRSFWSGLRLAGNPPGLRVAIAADDRRSFWSGLRLRRNPPGSRVAIDDDRGFFPSVLPVGVPPDRRVAAGDDRESSRKVLELGAYPPDQRVGISSDGGLPSIGLALAAATSDWTPEPVIDDEGRAIATYRLLMLEQVARALRGSPVAAPRNRLEHDLYALAEAAAVDRELARDFRGIAGDLRTARARALRERPALERLTALERRVERLVQAVLAADPASPPSDIPVMPAPAASREWARVTARRLRDVGGRYRGVAIVALWGRLIAAPASASDRTAAVEEPLSRAPMRSAPLPRRPATRQAVDGEDDEKPGTWMIRADEPMEAVEDPMGLQRPADRDDDASAADLADSLAEIPEARIVRTPGAPREVLDSDAGTVARAPLAERGAPAGAGIVYPEWDYRLGAYRQRGAVVWPRVAPAGASAWVDGVMARHAALVRRVRRRFDGLRPRRVRVGRQDDGPDLDLSAYVAAFADWRAGQPGDDRFYAAARPARRELALTLLIDISASTDGWIGGGQRIIDVEKESLIVLLEALDALGDRHAAVAFSGEGAGGVRVLTVKDFAEPVGPEVRRRVAALEPDGYTRTGAALRHASALLAREPARRRLLLVLSDGKPNDVDHYAGRYGIRDTAQAVAEARAQGLVPFCLTVDREAPAYMPSLFGPRGWALLRRQDLLPTALVEVVRRLLVT